MRFQGLPKKHPETGCEVGSCNILRLIAHHSYFACRVSLISEERTARDKAQTSETWPEPISPTRVFPLQAAARYPSIKRKSIIQDIKTEFREGKAITDPREASFHASAVSMFSSCLEVIPAQALITGVFHR